MRPRNMFALNAKQYQQFCLRTTDIVIPRRKQRSIDVITAYLFTVPILSPCQRVSQRAFIMYEVHLKRLGILHMALRRKMNCPFARMCQTIFPDRTSCSPRCLYSGSGPKRSGCTQTSLANVHSSRKIMTHLLKPTLSVVYYQNGFIPRCTLFFYSWMLS